MTFAEQMVAKCEERLLQSVGMKTVMIDGQTISYADLEQKYEFWKSKVEREAGTKARVAQVDLSGF